MKRIWIVATGEPLPFDGDQVRLHRAGLLAREMADRGAEVTWWTTSFDHIQKRRRPLPDAAEWAGVHIRMLRVPGYRKNVSLRRLFDHLVGGWRAARTFRRLPGEDRPDVIVVALPTLELCVAATWYGKRAGVPVLVDVRDWWPDYFLNPFPSSLHPLLRIPLAPYYWMARYACRNAAGITGISEPFVDWGLRHARRPRQTLDRCHYFTYVTDEISDADRRDAATFWDRLGVQEQRQSIRLCFLGTLATSMDLDTAIAGTLRAREAGIPAELVICGDGEERARLEASYGNESGILFAGFVDRPKLVTLMARSDLAIAPYRPEPSFEATISNKMVEYLAGGLPVLTSLQQGAFVDLASTAGFARTYPSGDPEYFADLLREFTVNPELLTQMAGAATVAYQSSFQYDRVMTDWFEHLSQLATTSSGNAD